MGGIYSTTEKSAANLRQNNGNSLINFSTETAQMNSGSYASAFHPSSIGSVSRQSHNELNNSINGAFGRTLNPNMTGTHGTFSLQNQRTRDKGNDELLNYRYIPDGNLFQPRNLSLSPNSMISNQFKTQHYSHNQLLLNNSLQQSRQGNVLPQLNVTKNEVLQTNQLHQSCSKLNSDVSNRVNSSTYPLNAQHINQSGIFQANKRLHLLSQPPNKRPRLSHDFTNMSHQNPNNISQGSHFLNLNHSENKTKLSSSPQKHIQNMSIYKGNLSSSNGLWQNKEPSYYPQVEAISPVPDDMHHCDLKSATEKDDIGEKLRDVEDEIIKQQDHVNRLKEKSDFLNNKINQPNFDNYNKEEDSFVPVSRDPIKQIISNNQRKASEQHQLFQRLCGDHVAWSPLTLPLYKQPSDIELLINVKNHFHKSFKPVLMKYIRRRKMAERARLKMLAQNYELSAKAWYKRLEKFENSAKRRQKELKYREQFEKIFPEIKRNREDKEKDSSELGDGLNLNYDNVSSANTFANTRSVSHNCNGVNISDQQRSHTPYDSIKENEKMKEYAIDPPIILPNWNKNFGLIECARLIKDPKHKHINFQNYKTNWSREEIEIFKEQYINTPKNFGRIATFLQKKTASDCIQFYYLTKKTANYKTLVKKNARRRRVQAERQQRFRSEPESNNIVPIQQPTSELPNDNSSHTTETTKIESMLPHNFIDIDSNSKEIQRQEPPQRNMFNSENSNQQSVKFGVENKNPITPTLDPEKKPPAQDQAAKPNKDTNVRCAERNSILRDSRDSDSDENDDIHRSHIPTDCLVNSSSSSQFNKNQISEPEYKPEKEKQSDKCSDNFFNNTTKPPSTQSNLKFEFKPSSSSMCKSDYIHIKDAIEFSIEQSLSQCLENKREVNKFHRIDSGSIKNFNNHSFFQNLDDSNLKNNVSLDNLTESYKHNYPPQIIRESSAFQEIKNVDKSAQLSSTFNRKILMKDFCTAQMMNHPPLNNALNSKSNSLSLPKIPSTSNYIDPYMSDSLNKSSNAMAKKSDFFIDRVSKLYEEEVEPYTDEFRNRSDSQRTRTSSEASQMYAYIKDRNSKNEHRSKHALSSKAYHDEKNVSVTDSRLKMPPPDVTDQKVFRSQKNSFCSKKNPYSKAAVLKDCDISENEPLKSKLLIDDSVEDDVGENTEKRKVVTAANILNSIIDKNAHGNSDVKLITATNKICDNHLLKTNDNISESSNSKSHFVKNPHMTLDGHIKQNISDKKMNCLLENKIECSKKNYNIPLKKRDKPTITEDRNSLELFNKSPILANSNKKTKIPGNSSDSLSKYCLEKNNNLIFKEKVEVDADDNYDSESPSFNSSGKLLIDLGNNSEGF